MLPDPRRYAGAADHPLVRRALANESTAHLAETFRELAVASRDDEIRAALASAPSAQLYRELWHALCAAVEKPGRDEVSTRVFAMPWVIVCGGTDLTIDCVLRDPDALRKVFEEHGVFGGSLTIGLSNVLCALDTLEALPPGQVLRGWQDEAVRSVPPAPIAVSRAGEEVHVRFLLGAAVTPAHSPDVTETGANVGAWGTPALRAMGAQLATPGAQVLAMPRPPAGLYSAAHAGRRAAIETAFNLFVSNTVRRARLALGDPAVTVSAHEGGELRITLWSPLDDGFTEGFRWPLHPADDFEEVERTIYEMISECRLDEPHVARTVLPDRSPTGAVLFPAAAA